MGREMLTSLSKLRTRLICSNAWPTSCTTSSNPTKHVCLWHRFKRGTPLSAQMGHYTEWSPWKVNRNNQNPRSLPGYKLQSCGLMKGRTCVWEDMGLWLCWSEGNAEATQGPLADEGCSTGSQSTAEKPLRRHHLSSRPKRFFESFKCADASSCLGLHYF